MSKNLPDFFFFSFFCFCFWWGMLIKKTGKTDLQLWHFLLCPLLCRPPGSLLHRPLFIKFSLLTTKQIISPATSTRVKSLFFSGVAVQLGRFSFLMFRWVDIIFRIIYWFQKGAIEVDYPPGHPLAQPQTMISQSNIRGGARVNR